MEADWDKPFGVNTPRVDTRVPKQASGFPEDDKPAKLPVEDRSKRSESDGNPTIWSAYEEGY